MCRPGYGALCKYFVLVSGVWVCPWVGVFGDMHLARLAAGNGCINTEAWVVISIARIHFSVCVCTTMCMFVCVCCMWRGG